MKIMHGWITWSHCWTSTDGNVRTLIASGCYTHCVLWGLQ